MNFKRFFQSIFNPDFDDIERLVKAFPSELEDDVRTVASILPFDERTFLLVDGTERKHDFLVTEFKPDDLSLGNETIRLPYRVYLNEPEEDQVKGLTETQLTILNCIYLRHNDGYVRQRHLEKLTERTDSFICPFTVSLLGEYVIEILIVMEGIITGKKLNAYARFLSENEFFWLQTRSRVVSYWNEYYRQEFPRLTDYVGKRHVDRLNVAIKNFKTK